jgi:hypothetical protein
MQVDRRRQNLILRMHAPSRLRPCDVAASGFFVGEEWYNVGAVRASLIGRRMSGGSGNRHCVRLQPDAASAVGAHGYTFG